MPLRGSPSKGEQTRNAILRAAARAFRERGYDAATLEEIASGLGLTRSAVLFHFGSKEEILREIVDPFFADLDALLDGVDPVVSGRQRRTFLTDFVDVLCDHRCVASLLTRDVTAQGHLGADAGLAQLASRFVQIVDGDGTTTGTIRAHSALGAVLRPLNAPVDELDFTDPRNRRQLVDSALTALRA